MKKLALLLICLALPLAAQQAPEATPEQLKQALQIVIAQRNQLSANVLDVQAQLEIVARENEALKKQVAELQAKLADAAKPKAEGVATNAQPHPEKKS